MLSVLVQIQSLTPSPFLLLIFLTSYEKMNREKLYNVMIKYIAPVMLVIILITYSMAQFGFFTM